MEEREPGDAPPPNRERFLFTVSLSIKLAFKKLLYLLCLRTAY